MLSPCFLYAVFLRNRELQGGFYRPKITITSSGKKMIKTKAALGFVAYRAL
jgi:hypothetical protein